LHPTLQPLLPLPHTAARSRANGPIDHMPPVMYEFEIGCAQRGDRRDSMYSRVMQAPNPLAL
jgi:hypothetical protein